MNYLEIKSNIQTSKKSVYKNPNTTIHNVMSESDYSQLKAFLIKNKHNYKEAIYNEGTDSVTLLLYDDTEKMK
eukprot:CAMPEP_0116896238 /NCGR_PEP_ID=MMETSP0467-20121206/5532_1 /TAXON_ID=283647 /ORGANISM="Mesodinium pulex, Strain SPMC105" /LENGTH=72 /DNA_ID=CAMNT_0004567309 /DNA_START=147 /DNA_END=365 /DNA_ORIENTATION=+